MSDNGQFYSYDELRASVEAYLPKRLYDTCLVDVITADRNYYQTYSIKCNKDGSFLALHGAKGICRTIDCLRVMFDKKELFLLPDLAIASVVNDYFPGTHSDGDVVSRFADYICNESRHRLSVNDYRWHYNSRCFLPCIDYLSSIIDSPSFASDKVVSEKVIFAKLIASSFEAVFDEYTFTYVNPDFSKWFP